MTDPLLSLETLIVRPTIEIDGTTYELLAADELSVLQSQRCSIWARRLEEMEKAEAEDPAADELIDRIVRDVVVDLPQAVFAKLTGQQKLAVVSVFTALLLRHRMGVAGATAKAIGATTASLSTGGLSFQGFNGSTAGTRANGWRARLSAWFARTQS